MNAETRFIEDTETAVRTSRILVVEDERIVARGLQRQLTALGYEVVATVPSGEEAIRHAEEHRPDLVLMDINLEGPMDGVEAAAAIRQQFQIPVVYLTAYSNMEILERAKITEPFGYILKPFEDRELHVVIETGLYKHEMERRLQQRERWFAATLKSIGDAVIATDEAGLITYMNPVAERWTGWAKQDAVGHAVNEVVRLVDEETRQPVEVVLDPAKHERDSRRGQLLVARDRSVLAIEDCVSFITDDQGGPIGTVLVFRDVTARKHLEEQLRQAKKLEAISQLAGGVAHSFNNLMTSILGYSEIMLQSLKPGDLFFAGALEIRKSAVRTAALTQKLLAFGRKQVLAVRPIDLNVVVASLSQVITHMKGGVHLDLSLEPGLGTTRADSNRLEEAILTLARNACDAMPNGGRIGIKTANLELEGDGSSQMGVPSRPYVMLEISDSGKGMSQEAISHLFEPFNTTATGVGAGLGLAAVYGFVKQCGGEIDVQSKPGEGATFHLYFSREVTPAEGSNAPANMPH